MSFVLESDLCRALVGVWSAHFAPAPVSVVREVRVGSVIPDLVAFQTTVVPGGRKPFRR